MACAPCESLLADAPNSRVLVTTRDARVATALLAKELSLNAMSDDESRELLAAWAGESADGLPAAAGDVMRRCGRLPLALAIHHAYAIVLFPVAPLRSAYAHRRHLILQSVL